MCCGRIGEAKSLVVVESLTRFLFEHLIFGSRVFDDILRVLLGAKVAKWEPHISPYIVLRTFANIPY